MGKQPIRFLPRRVYREDFIAETLPRRLYREEFTVETLPRRLYYRDFTMETLPQRLYLRDFTSESLLWRLLWRPLEGCWGRNQDFIGFLVPITSLTLVGSIVCSCLPFVVPSNH